MCLIWTGQGDPSISHGVISSFFNTTYIWSFAAKLGWYAWLLPATTGVQLGQVSQQLPGRRVGCGIIPGGVMALPSSMRGRCPGATVQKERCPGIEARTHS